METTTLTFDPERSIRIFKKYFDYHRKRELEKFPSLIIFGISLVLFVLGMSMNIDFLLVLGLIVFALSASFLILFFLKYKTLFNRFSKQILSENIVAENSFTFSFDNNEIIKESKDVSQKINWALIKSYEENQGDLYLFFEKRELYDIISVSIIGEEMFDKFKSILVEKIKA